jgi:hypothetical protein
VSKDEEVVKLEGIYGQLPYDLSGSMSKNRFRNEMLWGLSKIFDLFKAGKDFCVVFDYVCDIEVHLDSEFEFYQLKTSNGGKPYTLSKVIKPDKVGNSIFGKVYCLKDKVSKEADCACKIAIVVNAPFKDGNKMYNSVSELELVDLPEKSKQTINSAIKAELNLKDDIDLENVFYLYSTMDLINPQEALIGKTVQFFVDVYGEEPKKVTTLFQLLEDTVSMKASYEKECGTISELWEKKGISKFQFEQIIKKYINVVDDAVPRAKQIIDDVYVEFGDKLNMKRSLARIVQEIIVSQWLNKLQYEIAKEIICNVTNYNNGMASMIKTLLDKYASDIGLEYSVYEKQAYIVLIIARLEEGCYEAIGDK